MEYSQTAYETWANGMHLERRYEELQDWEKVRWRDAAMAVIEQFKDLNNFEGKKK